MVFHGSNIQDLEVIKPQPYFNAKEPLIFASRNLHIATLYIDKKGGEFACTIVMDHHFKMPVIVERMRDGIRKRFGTNQGSVYGLRNDTFDFINLAENLLDAEMISRNEQLPLIEMKFENSLQHILQLDNQKKIRIIPFKDRHEYLPKSDLDLKRLFAKFLNSADPDSETLAMIKAYHPTIYKDVMPKHAQ